MGAVLRKSQISVDGADRMIARVHGTRYGPFSTKLQWHVALSCIVVVPRHAREEASAIVRGRMHSDDDESAYRDDVNHLVRWCASNDLVLNVSKTKEIVVDFRKSKSVPSTLIVNNSEVEIVDSFKFLGIHITSNLSWSLQARYMCKKGQQRLYFLRCLKKFHMKPEILVNFYRSIIESILTGSIMVWFGNMTDADRNSLSRVIRTARRLTGVDLPDLREIFYCRMKSRIHKVIADPSHPAFTFFEFLPSGKRYRSLGYSGMSARTSNSLYPTAVRVLNDHIH